MFLFYWLFKNHLFTDFYYLASVSLLRTPAEQWGLTRVHDPIHHSWHLHIFVEKKLNTMILNKISVLFILLFLISRNTFWTLQKKSREINKSLLFTVHICKIQLRYYPCMIEHTKQLLTSWLCCILLSLPHPWLYESHSWRTIIHYFLSFYSWFPHIYIVRQFSLDSSKIVFWCLQ